MKIIVEGSPSDIREFVNSTEAIQEAALAAERLTEAEGREEALREEIVELEKKVASSESSEEDKQELTMLRTEVAALKHALISASEELKKVQEDASPVRLTKKQQEQVEALFAQRLEEAGAPLVFVNPNGKEITAQDMLVNIFTLLSSGNRVQAIRAVREFSGLKLISAKNLIDNALKAFGCSLDHKGVPTG
jgi:ribosomal protein L7/L12